MPLTKGRRRRGSALRTVVAGVAFVAVVAFLMMLLAGVFHRKINSEVVAEPAEAGRPVGDAQIVEARLIEIPLDESAVGTIRAVHETAVASKLLAKVVQVNVTAGQHVKAGDVLARLDDTDLQAKLKQAEAELESARATQAQAKIEYDRIKELHDGGQAAQIEFDRASTALKSAEAGVDRAEQAQREAEAVLDYATIKAPITGIVVDKQVEEGDTAQPGEVLLTLYDPTRMQLVARVRESLAHRLNVGQSVDVRVDALRKTCQGTVSEIVPEAESASRSFSVKVTGPCPTGVYSGMFGRMYIPLGTQQVLVIPQAAIRHVGQLDLIDVVVSRSGKDVRQRRVVELGKTIDDSIEVLAGLAPGERVAVPAAGELTTSTG